MVRGSEMVWNSGCPCVDLVLLVQGLRASWVILAKSPTM